MGKLKNKLIDEQDQKLIEAEKQEFKPVRDWAEIAADDEARYQAYRGNDGGVRWTGD
jgi:nitrate reductase alpha subunit